MIIEIIKIKFYQNVATTFYGVVERKSSLKIVNKAKKNSRSTYICSSNQPKCKYL